MFSVRSSTSVKVYKQSLPSRILLTEAPNVPIDAQCSTALVLDNALLYIDAFRLKPISQGNCYTAHSCTRYN